MVVAEAVATRYAPSPASSATGGVERAQPGGRPLASCSSAKTGLSWTLSGGCREGLLVLSLMRERRDGPAAQRCARDVVGGGDLRRCLSWAARHLPVAPEVYAFPNGSHRASQVGLAQTAGLHNTLVGGERPSRLGAGAHPTINTHGASTSEARARIARAIREQRARHRRRTPSGSCGHRRQPPDPGSERLDWSP